MRRPCEAAPGATFTVFGKTYTAHPASPQGRRRRPPTRAYDAEATSRTSATTRTGLLGLGDDRDSPPHRRPNRGDAGAQPPQHHPVQAAHHRRGRPAAADRPLEDGQGTASARQPRTRRRPRRHHLPSPRRRPGPSRSSAPTTAARRVWNPPMPLLFQWRIGGQNRPISDDHDPQGSQRGPRLRRADRRRRPAARLPPARLPKDLHHRRHPQRPARPTSRRSSPVTPTSTPPWATTRSTPRRPSRPTARSSPAAGRSVPARSTGPPTDEEWDEFLGHFETPQALPRRPADEPTEPPASTNTPASDARSSGPIR